ncbi:hypothetical protein V1503_24375 [Bacillus sp. SCS-151]|uniref:hypothetical protein n=1 Tax=Nanhaiella sioensis TaxID=3115293 RepID=UPI003979D603
MGLPGNPLGVCQIEGEGTEFASPGGDVVFSVPGPCIDLSTANNNNAIQLSDIGIYEISFETNCNMNLNENLSFQFNSDVTGSIGSTIQLRPAAASSETYPVSKSFLYQSSAMNEVISVSTPTADGSPSYGDQLLHVIRYS